MKIQLSQIMRFLLPCCCALCQLRQEHSICDLCLTELTAQMHSNNCLLCGSPNRTWVCKYCFYAKWAFDQTLLLCPESSRLIPLIKACNDHGKIQQLPAILYAWQHFNFRRMAPVDLLIPLPQSPKISKQHGYWLALELAKKWSYFVKTPYNTKILLTQDLNPHTDMVWPSFKLNQTFLYTHSILNLRISIVMPILHSELVLNDLAQLFKAQGVKWVAFWALTRSTKKDFY
jgi:predicted amidophosphoribosyltransferase